MRRHVPLFAVALLATFAWYVAWRTLGGDAPLHGYTVNGLISLSLNEGPVYAAVTMIQALVVPAIALSLARAKLSERLRPLLDRPVALAVILGLFAVQVALALAFGPLDRHPITDDESAIVFQSKLVAAGMLSSPAPPFPASFAAPFLVFEGVQPAGHWTGAFEWAQPTLLALFGRLRFLVAPIELLVAIVFGATAAGEMAARDDGPGDARATFAAAGLLATSPALLLTAATMHEASLGAMCGAIVVWAIARLRRRASVGAIVALGLALAVGANARWFDLTLLFAGSIIWLFLPSEVSISKKTRSLLLALLTASPGILGSLAIHRRLFGRALATGLDAFHAQEGTHTFGLRAGTHHGVHDASTAAFKAFTSLTHLSMYATGCAWVFVIVLPGLTGVFSDSARVRSKWTGPIVVVLTYVVGYCAWAGIQQTVTGPINYLALVPLLVAWVSAAAVDLHDRLAPWPSSRDWMPGLVFASALASLAFFWPSNIVETVRVGEASEFCERTARRHHIDEGVVFVDLPAGNWAQTWIATPPTPTPFFDDRLLYVWSRGYDRDAELAARIAHGRPLFASTCLLAATPFWSGYDPV
ncbi:MAG: hypothetical protein ACHREM_28075, partial [Polyangiales bacterium]